jgi:hypothetical protein
LLYFSNPALASVICMRFIVPSHCWVPLLSSQHSRPNNGILIQIFLSYKG